MIVVRNTFTAKPGSAGKLVAKLKEMTAAGNLENVRFFTDITGNFNTVVMDFEIEALSEYEAIHEKYMSDPAVREKAAGYTELWESGKREFLRVA